MKPQNEKRQTEPKPVDRTTRHTSLENWFWWLVERVVELRGCCLSDDSSRERAILRQLEARRFTAAEAALAEHSILFGQWSAEKTLRIGLELSDFYPEELMVTSSEWESLRRRLYRAIEAQVHQDIQQQTEQTQFGDEEQNPLEPYKQALREMNQYLQQANERVSIAVKSATTLRRDLHHADRREKLLEAKLITANEVILSLKRVVREQTMDRYDPNEVIPGQLSLFPEEESNENGEFWDVFEEDESTDSLLPPL